MFFGTRAKVYFCWAMAPAAPMARSPATMAVPVKYFNIRVSSTFPFAAYSIRRPALLRSVVLAVLLRKDPLECGGNQRFAAALHAEKNRKNDEGADECALPIGIDARHQQCVANDLEQGRADHGAESRAGAPHQICAADDGGGDHAQLIGLAHRIDRRATVAKKNERCDGGGEGREYVSKELDSI